MAGSLESRIDKLEILYAEQDQTVQALNDMVAHQEREISRLRLELDQLRQRLQAIKSELADDIDPAHDKPPHY